MLGDVFQEKEGHRKTKKRKKKLVLSRNPIGFQASVVNEMQTDSKEEFKIDEPSIIKARKRKKRIGQKNEKVPYSKESI